MDDAARLSLTARRERRSALHAQRRPRQLDPRAASAAIAAPPSAALRSPGPNPPAAVASRPAEPAVVSPAG